MRKIIHLYILFFTFSAWSQRDTLIHIHKFPNGKTSTISVINNNRDGYAKAYNFKGEVIYHREIRHYAGSSSVHFSHHPNGIVKQANYSSHPDGGIQWYRTYTNFDEKGNITGEIEDNWDTGPTHYYRDTISRPNQNPYIVPIQPKDSTQKLPAPNIPQEPIHNPQPVKPEIAKCASIHQNRTEFVNHSKFTILLQISHKGQDTIVRIKPGKVYVGPIYISAEVASPMNQNVQFTLNCESKNCVIDSTAKSKALAQYETMHIVNFYGQRKIIRRKKT